MSYNNQNVIPALVFIIALPMSGRAVGSHLDENTFNRALGETKRAVKAEVSLRELISQEELNKAIEISLEKDGTYSVRARASEEAEKVRSQLRAKFEGVDILTLAFNHFDEEVELSVFDKPKSTISKKTGPFLGAAVIAALSMPSRDRFQGGRRLFLRDQKKQFTSLSLLSRETETVEAIRSNLKAAKESADHQKNKFTFTQSYKRTEPPAQFFEWDENDKQYKIVFNETARSLWEDREAASRALEHPTVVDKLRETRARMSHGKSPEKVAEEFLSSEQISPIVYPVSKQGQRAGILLKRAIVKFLNGKEDPNHPESFQVSKRALGYREPVVSWPDGDVERVAFVFPDGNSGLRRNTARNSGISRIHNISRPSQAIPIIKQIHESTGKQVEVCFCSHGSPGMLTMASPSSGEVDLLTRETRGMVCRGYALGCSVGAQAENTSRPHLLRELSVGWGVPVSAVDQTLYLDNQKWYLQGSGRLVTVHPKNQEVDSDTLIDQTPVWKVSDSPFNEVTH